MKQTICKVFSCLMVLIVLALPFAGLAEMVLPLPDGQNLYITAMENDLIQIEDFETPLGIAEEPAFNMILLIASVLLVAIYAIILVNNQRKLNDMRRCA